MLKNFLFIASSLFESTFDEWTRTSGNKINLCITEGGHVRSIHVNCQAYKKKILHLKIEKISKLAAPGGFEPPSRDFSKATFGDDADTFSKGASPKSRMLDRYTTGLCGDISFPYLLFIFLYWMNPETAIMSAIVSDDGQRFKFKIAMF